MSGRFTLSSLFGSGSSGMSAKGDHRSSHHDNTAQCSQLAQNVADMLSRSSMGDVPGAGVDQTVALMRQYDSQCGGFGR